MRSDTFASFCEGKEEEWWFRNGSDQGLKDEKRGRRTNLFAHRGEAVQEPNRVHDELVEVGDNSPLWNRRNLKETHCEKDYF